VTQLVETAWASASTFRGTDKRGGANGGRIRLSPQKDWEVNNPSLLKTVIGKLESIQTDFNNAQTSDKKISFADLVVLGGCAGIEKAAQIGGHNLSVPFTPGRTDATQEMTDVDSFAVLEPTADGFRNFVSKKHYRDAADSLIDRSHMLTLSGPEMTALLGGLRVLNVNTAKNKNGVLTNKSDTLSNDFFTNLLDLSTEWKLSDESTKTYEGIDRVTGNVKWVGSSVDLTFGSNSQLRAVAEVYASDDSESMFINDFVAAWTKVMNLDRFDI
jgi:catalase-peroxidase